MEWGVGTRVLHLWVGHRGGAARSSISIRGGGGVLVLRQ